METPEMRLQRGTRIKLVDDKGIEMAECLYIGVGETGDHILVPVSKTPTPPPVGAVMRGQCFLKGEMTTFTTKLMEIIEHPLSLWRVLAPTDVSTFDLRDNERTRCTVSATVEAPRKGLVVVGIIRDISKSGARCIFAPAKASAEAFDIDDPVTLRCEFPGIPGEQVASASITDITESETETSIGIRFTSSAWWVPPYH